MRDQKAVRGGMGLLTGPRALAAAGLSGVLVLLLGLPCALVAGRDGLGGIDLSAASSVRSIAMGENGLMETGSTLGFGLNPAGLPFHDGSGAAAGYNMQDKGLSATRSTLSGVMTIGRGFDVPGVDAAGKCFGLGLEFDHSELKLSQGSVWSTETIAAGAGYRVLPYASFGVLLKTLFSNTSIEGTDVSAFGLDFSALLQVRPDLSLALSVRNLGGSASWEAGDDEALPLLFSFGGHTLLRGRISADLTVSVSGSDQTKGGLGLELPIPQTGVCLRGGYSYQGGGYSRSIPSFGLGVAYLGFQIDYAARLDDDLALGTSHHFSITYLFGSGF